MKETASVITSIPRHSSGISSQVAVGSRPVARTMASTATRLRAKLKTLVRTTEQGTTARGNAILRSVDSFWTIEGRARLVASVKNWKSSRLRSSIAG